jgi:hypothetical protein
VIVGSIRRYTIHHGVREQSSHTHRHGHVVCNPQQRDISLRSPARSSLGSARLDTVAAAAAGIASARAISATDRSDTADYHKYMAEPKRQPTNQTVARVPVSNSVVAVVEDPPLPNLRIPRQSASARGAASTMMPAHPVR